MNYVNIIQDLIQWIEKNLDRSLSVDDVAKKSGYSKWHLQRIFKSETDTILGTYIRMRRLTHAAIALRLTNKPILDIAMQYQFDSQQTFTRAFKKQFNQTPANYRKAQIWHLAGITPYLELTPAPVIEGKFVTLELNHLVGMTHSFSCSLKEIFEIKKNFRSNFWMTYFEHCPDSVKLPPMIYGLTKSLPSKTNHEERDLFYTTAVEREYANDCQLKMEEQPSYSGEYIYFHFADHPDQFTDFIMRIYAYYLPKLRVSRREGPDIEAISLKDLQLQHHAPSNRPDFIQCEYYIPIIRPDN